MRLPILTMVSCLAVPAWGQTQPDNTAILKAIQDLSNRLDGRIDGLQKDVDQLKNKRAPATSTPSALPTAAKPSAPKGKAIAGWLVSVVPPTDDDDTNAVAQFAGPTSNYDFSLHTKLVSGQQQFKYFGEAFFHAGEDGHYVFIMEAAPVFSYTGGGPWQFNCETRMTIKGTRIIDDATKYRTSTTVNYSGDATYSVKYQTFQGGADLENGDWRVTFVIGCFLNDSKRAEPLDRTFQLWMHNRVKLMVRTPDDSAPRAFAPNELFHVVKGRL